MESMQNNKNIAKHASFREKSFGEIAQLKSEVILYKRRYERMKQKEKRIQVCALSVFSGFYKRHI